jgi:hypothetical protein
MEGNALYLLNDVNHRFCARGNSLMADKLFKDKIMIIHGNFRLFGNLTSGEPYISLHARQDFSDVVAILDSNELKNMDYYTNGAHEIVLACIGGYVYNEAGSHGLRGCRFLADY